MPRWWLAAHLLSVGAFVPADVLHGPHVWPRARTANLPAFAPRRPSLVPARAAADTVYFNEMVGMLKDFHKPYKDSMPTPAPGMIRSNTVRALDVLADWKTHAQTDGGNIAARKGRIEEMIEAISSGNCSHVYAVTAADAPSMLDAQDTENKTNKVLNPDANTTVSVAARMIRAIGIVRHACVGGVCGLVFTYVAENPTGSPRAYDELLRALGAWAVQNHRVLMITTKRDDKKWQSRGFLPLGGEFEGIYMAVPAGHTGQNSLVELAMDATPLTV